MHILDLMDTLHTALRYRVWAASRDYATVDAIPDFSVYTLWVMLGKPRNIQLLGAGYYIVECTGQGLTLWEWDEGNTEEAQNQLRRVYKTLEDTV